MRSFPVTLFTTIVLVFAAQPVAGNTAAVKMSQQSFADQPSGSDRAEPRDGTSDHESDSEPMVYETPRDYATSARQSRERLISDGVDPNDVILESEVRNHIPRKENETPAEFAKRYSEEMNAMIRRGVYILNDQCTADVVASVFCAADGRVFDLGPGSGATRGEFRKFNKWFLESLENGQLREVPEQWAKFERLDKQG